MLRTSIPFQETDRSAWIAQLNKELQEQTQLLQYKDPIEGFSIDLTERYPSVGVPSPTSEYWTSFYKLNVQNEKAANKLILSALMEGAAGLLLHSKNESCNWELVLEGVEVAYIKCWIQVDSALQNQQLQKTCPQDKWAHLSILNLEHTAQNYFSGFDIQQAGANISCQLSSLLIDLHRSLENHSVQTHYVFELGIGNNYFQEIAKFRAFRHLLTRLEAVHECSIAYQLLGSTGFSNKSLKDPYTNLLRLATEALSAVNGGADAVCIQPYDALSQDGADDFSRRMALNIGNLIQEEAQMNQTQDPLKNANVIEALTTQIVNQTWQKLLALDQQNQTEQLLSDLEKTRQHKTEAFQKGAATLIGINAFENTFEVKNKNWGTLPTYHGVPYLIFELV
jgi:methylmalonyl-CoA mutase